MNFFWLTMQEGRWNYLPILLTENVRRLSYEEVIKDNAAKKHALDSKLMKILCNFFWISVLLFAMHELFNMCKLWFLIWNEYFISRFAFVILHSFVKETPPRCTNFRPHKTWCFLTMLNDLLTCSVRNLSSLVSLHSSSDWHIVVTQ